MKLPLSFQAGQFLWAVILGLCYGVLYDLMRSLRRNAKWMTHLLDAWFALTFLIGNFLLALYVGNGQFRIFMLPAIAIGMTVWFLTLSRPFLWLSGKFWMIFCTPFRALWQLCKKILKKRKKY